LRITDRKTALSDTAKFVPGTYDLIVQAPGYGIQRSPEPLRKSDGDRRFLYADKPSVVDERRDRHLDF